VKQWFEGSSAGSLFKGDDWIEYSTDGAIEHSTSNTLQKFTTTNGELRVARYRWNWRPRSATDSVNEYANLLELVDTLSIGAAAYAECVQANIDIRNWMRTFAANDLSANLDSFGNVTGRNTYHYHPPLGQWSLFSWDFDVGLGVGGSAVDSPLFDVSDPALLPLFIVPEFTRRYWAALDEALADSFHNGPVDAWLDQRHAVLAAEGALAPAPIKTFVAQRRLFLESQVATNRSAWGITSPSVEFSSVSASNYFILSGTAPLSVDTVRAGEDLPPVRWLSTSNWSVAVALKAGSNVFNIYGVNRLGVPVPGASNRIVIVFNGVLAPRRGNVVLNEIHNRPDVPDTDFIELHNRSSTTAYDLKGGLLLGFVDKSLGLDIFPGVQKYFTQPLILPPNGYLLLAGSTHEFCRNLGHMAVPDAEYFGVLGFGPFAPYDLKLWHPLGSNPLLMEMISSVNYFPGFPWPDETDGHSLQLIDARSETWRPGNWTVDTNAPPTPRAPNSLRDQLPPFPAVRLNEILPLNTGGITDNAGDAEPWLELYSPLQFSTLTGLYLTDSALEPLRWPFPDGSDVPAGQFRLVWLDGETNETSGNHWHASFRPSSAPGAFVALTRQVQGQRTWTQVVDYLRYDLNGSNIPPNLSFGARTNGTREWRGFVQPYPTPLAPNSYSPAPQEEGPVINEWLASNTRYPDPTDGNFDDWFELYNPTDKPIDLIGYRLSQRATENTKFVIPSGYIIPPHGFLLVWADDDDDDNEPGTDLHVNFKLSRSGDKIYLFRVDGSLQDAVNFGNQIANVSQGRCPDGGFSAQTLVTISAGAPNVCPGDTVAPFALRLKLIPGPAAALSFPRGYNALIECTDDVGSGTWLEVVGPRVTGATETTVYDQTISAGSQRFYRARISGP
jgi:hypothetical protein